MATDGVIVVDGGTPSEVDVIVGGQPGPPGPGLPVGGEIGQTVAKASTLDFDTEWVWPFAVVDAPGDLLVGSAQDQVTRLAPPTKLGDVLTADPAQPLKMTWKTPPLAVVDAVGDLIVGTGDDTVGRLAVGAPGQVLGVQAGTPAWQTPPPTFGVVDQAGDLIVGSGNDAVQRLGIGTDGTWLAVKSGAVQWAPLGASDIGGLQPALDAKVDEDAVTVAGTRLVANKLAAGDAQLSFRILGSGQIEWGAGGGNALDTVLYRTSAGWLTLGTSAQPSRLGIRSTATAFGIYNAAEAVERLYIGSTGNLTWGPGTGGDTVLWRYAAGTLALGTTATKGRLHVYGSAVSDAVLTVLTAPDTQSRFFLRADGQMAWGDGAAVQDVTLARGGSGLLYLGTSSQKGRIRAYGGAISDVIFDGLVTTDAQSRWYCRADGLMGWGPGNAGADTFLYRGGAGFLQLGTTTQKGRLEVYGGAASDTAFDSRVTTDAQARWYIRADGAMFWGDGTAGQDTLLYRNGVGVLNLGSSSQKGRLKIVGGATTDLVLDSVVTTDVQDRFYLRADGYHAWGDGTNPTDTVLRRSSPGVLVTDGQLVVGSVSQGVLYLQSSGYVNARYASSSGVATLVSRVVTGDTQDRFQLLSGGQLMWGDGTNPQDTLLARGVANTLYLGTTTQIGQLRVHGQNNWDQLLQGRVGAEAGQRWYIRADGTTWWGDGTTAYDCLFGRGNVGLLFVGNAAQKCGLRLHGAGIGDYLLDHRITTDAQPRWYARADGLMAWGDGVVSIGDVTLQRAAAGTMQWGSATQAVTSRFCGGGVATPSVQMWYGGAGDTTYRLAIRADGYLQWTSGTASPDTFLSRGGVGVLNLGFTAGRGTLRIFGGTAADTALEAVVTTGIPRWYCRADGYQAWGDGTNPVDVTLYRNGADNLKTDDTFIALALGTSNGAIQATRSVPSGCIRAYGTGDSSPRVEIVNDARIEFGPGGAATTDTNLYRSAADRLKTNDLFDATTMALASKVKAGAPVDADWAVAPPDGTIVADSTGSRLWVRMGGAWKSVAVA